MTVFPVMKRREAQEEERMNLRESARYDQVRAGKLLGGGSTVTLDGWEEERVDSGRNQ